MKRSRWLGCMGIGLMVLFAPVAMHVPMRIVYNPSDSVARGWYVVMPADSLQVGSVVLAQLPPDASALAAQRGYLPSGIPLLKRIGAVEPQRVCIDGLSIEVDGVQVAVARRSDGNGRALPVWRQCRTLVKGELFLLSTTNAASFDSRYFGPIDASSVIGRAVPIWTADSAWASP